MKWFIHKILCFTRWAAWFNRLALLRTWHFQHSRLLSIITISCFHIFLQIDTGALPLSMWMLQHEIISSVLKKGAILHTRDSSMCTVNFNGFTSMHLYLHCTQTPWKPSQSCPKFIKQLTFKAICCLRWTEEQAKLVTVTQVR